MGRSILNYLLCEGVSDLNAVEEAFKTPWTHPFLSRMIKPGLSHLDAS